MLKKIYHVCLRKYKSFNNYVLIPKKVHRFFKKSGLSKKMLDFKDIHKGERCFIIGNGPSLRAEDLDKLKDEYCFASNFIGKIYDKTDWRPTYFCTMDPTYVMNNVATFLTYEQKNTFIAVNAENFKGAKKWFSNPDIVFCEMTHGAGSGKIPKFSDDLEKLMYGGYSVTYCLLQLAVYMGFAEIYLLGIDNNFSINKGFKGIISENKNGHFYKTATRESANVEGMTNAYIAARDYAKKNNLKIFNATRGGKLEVFDRVNFDDII